MLFGRNVEQPKRLSGLAVTVAIDLPANWQAESLPKSARIMLNGTEGIFEYLVSGKGSHFEVHSRLRINKCRFAVEDYDNLRNFYTAVIEKQNQMMVLKKK